MNASHKAVCLCVLTAMLALGSRSDASVPDQVFDSYGNISWKDEKARLDNFAVNLLSNPDVVGYILVYAGRRACGGEAQRRAIRAKKYVVEHRGVPWNRVIWRDEGHLEEMQVVLQPVPRGMSLPYPFYSFRLPGKDVQIVDCGAGIKPRRKRGE